MPRHILIDISNSFTKIARTDGERIAGLRRVPTPELDCARIKEVLAGGPEVLDGVVSSVVPERIACVRQVFAGLPLLEVSASVDLGIGIRYPHPSQIGADRLANAVAAAHLHGKPCVVVDFGTAVTFDVISAGGDYIGGVIAPGLNAMTSYLHEKTALLPKVRLEEPARAVGRSTREAMLAGAVYGYRGLIRGILGEIRREAFGGKKPLLVATGGDAELIGGGLGLFDCIDPLLTLHGLRLLALRHFGSHRRQGGGADQTG